MHSTTRRIEKTRMLDEPRSEDAHADEDPSAHEAERFPHSRPIPRRLSRRGCCACVTLSAVVVLLVLLVPLKMVYNGRLFWVFAARRY